MTERNVDSSTYSLTYDAYNHLVSVSGAASVDFVYDGDGQRVKVGGTVYIGDHYRYYGSGYTKFYFANGKRIALRFNTGSQANNYYYLSDHLNSSTVLVTEDRSYSSREGYKAWGETRFGNVGLHFKFTGEYYVSNIGLYHFGARFYDPVLGRFTQADTVVPEPGNAKAFDRYAYSYGNPVKYIDPDGHRPCSFSATGFICSISTFGLGETLDLVGEQLGVEHASDIVSDTMSDIALGLDIAAEATDFAASAIVTTGIVVGATQGAAITLPGGGTAVVTGAAGASVGWATTEIGVRPLILVGNGLASLATGFTLGSEVISGDTGFEANFGMGSEWIGLNSKIAIGSESQVSIIATTAGWISPLAYLSLLIQTGAVLGDIEVISPPPIELEFGLNLDDLE